MEEYELNIDNCIKTIVICN